jgi:phthiodiolone/phenolphthiodiolone dimycocerosates ketoreductase
VQVGVVLPCSFPLRQTISALSAAEGSGADSIWLTDHLLGVAHPELCDLTKAAEQDPDCWLDPMVVSAALGTRTGLPVGLAVTDGIRRRPADVARAAFTLSHLCPGGFNLGIGAGEAMNLIPFGYPFSHPVRDLETFLVDLGRLLDGLPLRGPGYTASKLAARGIARPAIWVAGHGPRMLRLTGEHGDGWLPAWPMSARDYGERLRTVSDVAAAAARPTPRAALYVNVLLGESRDAVLAELDAAPFSKLRALGAPGWLWDKHGVTHPGGPTSGGFVDLVIQEHDPRALRELAPRIPSALLADMWFVGSETEVMDRIRTYELAGCEQVVLADASGCLSTNSDVDAVQRPRAFADLIRALKAPPTPPRSERPGVPLLSMEGGS